MAIIDGLAFLAWLSRFDFDPATLWLIWWMLLPLSAIPAIVVMRSKRVITIIFLLRLELLFLLANFSFSLVLSTYETLHSILSGALLCVAFTGLFYIGWKLYLTHIHTLPTVIELIDAGLISKTDSTMRLGHDFGQFLRQTNEYSTHKPGSLWQLSAIAGTTSAIVNPLVKTMERDTQLLVLILLWCFLLMVFGFAVSGSYVISRIANDYETERKKTLKIVRDR